MMSTLLLSLHVFWEFFKIGLFAVGGGSATVPFLFELSEKTGWFTSQELTDMIAISESTPGPLGVNMATYVGFKTLGFFGGVISTFGLVLPSIIIILIVAKFLSNFSQNPHVKRAFWGIRPAVTALIATACISIWRASLLTEAGTGMKPVWGSIIICLIAVPLLNIPKFKKIHPGLWLLGAAVLGVVFRL